MSNVTAFFLWYLAFFAFGIIGLPITHYFFKDWRDKGYGFAKFIGMFVVGFVWWFLASIRVFQFTPIFGWILFIVGLGGAVYYIHKNKIKITKYMVIQELMFFGLMAAWSMIRATNARAEGTEKMMNLAFMNSIDKSVYFPPADPWFVGGNINYYYLGHYMYVVVSKLTGIPISYVYNLSLVTIISQTFIGLFSIFVELFKKNKTWITLSLAGLGATWISFAGNLHYANAVLRAYFKSEELSYYFPDPTRIIDFTINEFPSYSIVLGDVHGHYLGLPFLIIAIALALVGYRTQIGTKKKLKFNAMISPLIVALYAINSWDLITVFFLFTVVHLVQVYRSHQETEERIKHFILAEVALLVPGLILLVPFIIHYSPAVGPDGGFPLGIVPFNVKSDPEPWLLMWGAFFISPLIYLGLYYANLIDHRRLKKFPLILLFAAIALIIGVEFFFFKDIFFSSNNDYFRTNTVFKFYYHAWIIFGIASVWFVYAIIAHFKHKSHNLKTAALVIIAGFFIATTSYIFKAVDDFYPLNDPNINKTLDGIGYIKEPGIIYTNEKSETVYHTDEYDAIRWLQDNVEGQPTILEAVGEAYTYFARVSTTTGLPTVMGWPTHQWQWRGSAELAFDRKNEVDQFYKNETSLGEQREFIEKYSISYIYLGVKEWEVYGDINEERFDDLGFELTYLDLGGDPESSRDDTKIYVQRARFDESKRVIDPGIPAEVPE